MKKKKIILSILLFLVAILAGILLQKTLSSKKEVDLFSQVTIIFEGINEKATASVTIDENKKYEDAKLDKYLKENVTYSISPDSELKNGDVLTLTAKVDESILNSEYGYKPISLTTTLTVDTLGNYVKSIDSIKNIDELDAKATELLKTKLSSSVASEISLDQKCITVDGPKAKPDADYYRQLEAIGFPTVKGHNNAIVFMYKVNSEGLSKYYAISYYDLIVDSNGKVNSYIPIYTQPLKTSTSANELYNSISMYYGPKLTCE